MPSTGRRRFLTAGGVVFEVVLPLSAPAHHRADTTEVAT